MKQKRKTKRPKDRSATELLLLQAATKVFAQAGFAAATTRAIAKEAGVNLALITRYFGNKQGLLLAVVESGAERAHREDLPYPPAPNLMEEVLAFASAKLKGIIGFGAIYKILVVQSLTDKNFANALVNLELSDTNEAFNKRIAAHLKKEADSDEVLSFVALIDKAIVGTVIHSYFIAGTKEEKCLEELKNEIILFKQLN